MKFYFFILLLGLGLAGCEETVILNLDDYQTSMVIEGMVTNQPGHQYVKISSTTGFYDTAATQKIASAVVMILDDRQNKVEFVHNPSKKPEFNGYYFPKEVFVGEVGHIYSLHVLVDGKEYTAQDKLLPVAPIDSLESRISIIPKDKLKDSTRDQEILLYAGDPQNQVNYYLFRFYRNGIPADEGVYYADDKLLAGSIHGLASPMQFAVNDTATLEIYSLTREGYIFYQDMSKLLDSDGGIFNQPPSNSRSNLSNGAFGFFQVSALDKKQIVIKP